MRQRMKIVLCAILLLAIVLCSGIAIPAMAQAGATTARIAGTIYNDQHQPIAGVTITVGSALTNLLLTSQTDDYGLFAFSELPPGLYKLKAAEIDRKST